MGRKPLQIGLLDRPQQALQNLLVGDPWGAGAALVDPDELTIQERDALFKKYGLDKSPWAPVLRMVTNPLFLIFGALSIRFPIPTAENIFKVSRLFKDGEFPGYARAALSKLPFMKWARSSHSLFRGTDIPDDMWKIISDGMNFTDRYGLKMAEAITKFKTVEGRMPNRREQQMVAAWIDGLQYGLPEYGAGPLYPKLERAMSKSTLKLAKDLDKTLIDSFNEMYDTPYKRKKIVEALARTRSSGIDPENFSEAILSWIEDPKKIKKYFPHRMSFDTEGFGRVLSAILSDPREVAHRGKSLIKALSQVGPADKKRHFKMVPSFRDLNKIEDLLDTTEMEKVSARVKDKIIKGMKEEPGEFLGTTIRKMESLPLEDLMVRYSEYLGPEEARRFSFVLEETVPKQYSMDLFPTLTHYFHSMGRTYAWTLEGGGPRMVDHVAALRGLASAAGPEGVYASERAYMLENTYIPILSGRGTLKQALRSQRWNLRLMDARMALESPTAEKVLGKGLTGMLKETLTTTQGAFSLSNLNRTAASFFYLSTLGVNPSSPIKNLFQVVLTTGPMVGYGTAARGALQALKKSQTYFKARFGGKLSHEAALRKAYPEYAKGGLATSPITDEVVQNAMMNAFEVGSKLPGQVSGAGERIGRAMMSFFSLSEHAVRLTTFEAGMIHAARSKMPETAAIEFSRKLTEATQFMTGPTNTPYGLIDKTPLVRQLVQFQARFLEFATGTAWRAGSENMMGVNPYAFSRMVVGSMIAAEIGEAIGVDVEDALMASALPGFTEGKVLSPLPIVPPALQLGAAAGIGLAGDWGELKRSLPLTVPGGTALARAVGFVPGGEGVARLLERSYADYERPAPDGRIAVYTGQGVLRGYYTPWELVKAGMGRPGVDYRNEQDLVGLIVKNRDKIRAYRKEYLESRFKNQPGKANAIAKEFRVRFGFALPVTEENMKQMSLRKTMSRLEQVIQTMPPGPARDQAIELLQTVIGARGQELFGLDPSLLGEPQKVRNLERRPQVPQSPYTNRMSPLEEVVPYNIGRQREVPMSLY